MKAEKCQILFQGLIDESWSLYFTGMVLIAEPTGVTRLTGEIADQSALHGLLNKIRDLNLKLISVQLLDSDGVTPLECRYCRINKPIHDQNKPSNTTLDG
ncbi:MAG: hypothetical protein M1371_01870 [Actinobacteria bacterium]|nr:hypothetical protein [Actinomycetota bacterium]